MVQDIRLMKLVTGELVLGQYDKEAAALTNVALLQVQVQQQGMQIRMLPYGFPFEQEFTATIEEKHCLYTYKTLPDHLDEKYAEACAQKVDLPKPTLLIPKI